MSPEKKMTQLYVRLPKPRLDIYKQLGKDRGQTLSAFVLETLTNAARDKVQEMGTTAILEQMDQDHVRKRAEMETFLNSDLA